MNLKFLSKINKKIGIDLGSRYTKIIIDDGEIFVEETCLSIDVKTKKIIAIGKDAATMSGRVSPNIKLIWPIENGVVKDDAMLITFLKLFLAKVFGPVAIFNPVFMISVPVSISPAMHQLLIDTIYNLYPNEVFTIAKPLAASIGAGVPIADASGTFLLNIGHGLSQAVLISLGGVTAFEVSNFAGQYFYEKIQALLKSKFSIITSMSTIEEIVKDVIIVNEKISREKLIGGLDLHTKSPKEVQVKSEDFFFETTMFLEKIERQLKKLLSKMPPEMTVDVINKGLLLTGGVSHIARIEDYFVARLGIPVSVVEEPEMTTIKGISLVLENLDQFKESLGYQKQSF